jgi:ubiquinone/menaquinone biosynthesis C-methylase UbiE
MSWINSTTNRTTFLRLLSPKLGERILDVGGGKGAIALLVHDTGSSEVYALGPDKKRIAFIQRRYPKLKSCLSGSDSTPYPSSFFDKICSTMAVYHFPEQNASFKELARIVRPRGLLVIVEIAPHTFAGKIAKFLENRILRSHCTFLDLDELKARLKQENRFDIKETKEISSVYFILAVRTTTKH